MPEKTEKQPDQENEWFLYMIRSRDGHLYTGISTDVERRLAEHQSGKGAKYLRGKGPLQLVFQQKIGSRSAALKAEDCIKRLPKSAKEELVRSGLYLILA